MTASPNDPSDSAATERTDSPIATPPDTLYYDGQCSLCAAEIRQLSETRGDALKLRDIHELESDTAAGGKSRDELLRTLHLQRADGSWLSGADANVAAWEGTRQEKRLRWLRLPVIRRLVDLVYRVWAAWRYRRLYGAQYKEPPHASDTR